MAKSDLLKEAIADAKAVKETALANAKIALEEAFAPRIQSMLTAKLSEELDEDELPEAEMDMDMDMEAPAPAPEMDMEAPAPAPAPAPEMEMDMEAPAPAPEAPVDEEAPIEDGMMYAADENPADEEPAKADMMSEEDLELEAIIRELEEDLNEEDLYEEELTEDETIDEMHCGKGGEHEEPKDDKKDDKEMDESFNIDEIIEEILSEDDNEINEDEVVAEGEHDKEDKESKEKMDELSEELTEAYDTIESLRDTINEVNLLNAKLLYTNKLFRNFELSENQKMTVIENFDRAGNTREVKLVFSTLAESFQLPVKKKAVVKESFASKPAGTTAPSEPTKQIINEGYELANRWKKLAGLL